MNLKKNGCMVELPEESHYCANATKYLLQYTKLLEQVQAAGYDAKDAMREGPSMTSRSCDRDVITGPALIPTLGPEAAACAAHRRQDFNWPSEDFIISVTVLSVMSSRSIVVFCPKGKDEARMQLDSVLQDVNDKYMLLEETEKRAVYRALVEERGRFCMFVSFLKPVLDEEIGMLGEITHLQTILEDLTNLTTEPTKLPPMSEQVIHDLKNSDYNFIYQTPPASPSGTLSRKASTNSSLTFYRRRSGSMVPSCARNF
ncbi:unnamed protein product [Ranitomeya imitator]|uniref:IMD domain-containing protein n=1 Tax=Ranitomeya imitator TaxID=111125 RepID=A0ABN9L287_9NEOB|nr:unnamed protein product [Ranitomeya imitator]